MCEWPSSRKASVDEGDDINNYKTVLEKHINRMQVAEKVITELRPKMSKFHEQVGCALEIFEVVAATLKQTPCLQL
jgi:hypothetical protein